MALVLIFLSVPLPSGVLGLWACANLQGCHIDFVTGSLLLGRFSLGCIPLWVSYFCSVSPAQTEPQFYMAVFPPCAFRYQEQERNVGGGQGLKHIHPLGEKQPPAGPLLLWSAVRIQAFSRSCLAQTCSFLASD